MRHPDPSMLVRVAIADASAIAVEFAAHPCDEQAFEHCLAFDGYVANPRLPRHVASRYTDDAETSAAMARVLATVDPPYAPVLFADTWVREFRRGGRRPGYSRGLQGLLEMVRDGDELLSRIRPDSEKNGAAIRAPVVGVLRTVKDVLDVATLQAAITHNTPSALFSARAAALMAHFALYEDAPLCDAGDYCLRHLPEKDVLRYGYIFRKSWPGKPVVGTPEIPVSITTVHAAATLVMEGWSLMEILRRCVEWGGDTDSVAAIAWGIASPRMQDEVLPEWMERDLEQGNPKTGAVYLRSLGERLMRKFA